VADTFRALTAAEREVLEWMLEPRFPGRDELRAQLVVATVRDLDDGCLEFDCSAAPPAPTRWTIPTEGECADDEGWPVHVRLFVIGGFMRTLEIHGLTGSTHRGLPDPRRLTLFAPGSSCGSLEHEREVPEVVATAAGGPGDVGTRRTRPDRPVRS
jgi:hypothetical protein